MDGIRNIWTWNVNKLCRAVISGAVVASNVCDTVVVRLWAHVREHSPQGKYYCMAGILFDWFGFSSAFKKHIFLFGQIQSSYFGVQQCILHYGDITVWLVLSLTGFDSVVSVHSNINILFVWLNHIQLNWIPA